MHFKGKGRDSVLRRQLLGAEAKVYDETGHSSQAEDENSQAAGSRPQKEMGSSHSLSPGAVVFHLYREIKARGRTVLKIESPEQWMGAATPHSTGNSVAGMLNTSPGTFSNTVQERLTCSCTHLCLVLSFGECHRILPSGP